MPKKYWLIKCEPSAYTIDDLARDRVTSWEGVRNYQARNLLRDEMQVGDGVLFYASNADPSGVTGVAEVVRSGYPDAFAWRRGHTYYDPASRPDAPIWYTVDIRFVERFPGIVPLDILKRTPGLEQMMVTKKGSRLSVQPVAPSEFDIVVDLGRRATPGASSPSSSTAARTSRKAAPGAAATSRRTSGPTRKAPARRRS